MNTSLTEKNSPASACRPGQSTRRLEIRPHRIGRQPLRARDDGAAHGSTCQAAALAAMPRATAIMACVVLAAIDGGVPAATSAWVQRWAAQRRPWPLVDAMTSRPQRASAAVVGSGCMAGLQWVGGGIGAGLCGGQVCLQLVQLEGVISARRRTARLPARQARLRYASQARDVGL